MKYLGLALCIFGVLLVLTAFNYDAAPEGSYNLGLLQMQTMLLSAGGISFLAGAVFASVGHALSRLEQAGIIPAAGYKPLPQPVVSVAPTIEQ